MSRIDRLSVLISRFEISVSIASPGLGNLALLADQSRRDPRRIEFCPHGGSITTMPDEIVLLEASADLGGEANPLVTALPERVSLSADDDGTSLLLRLILAEAAAKRCGVGSVLSRLGEVLIIRLLRAEIERGIAEPGLLAGLADSRLSKGLVAIHEHPGRDWRNQDLATICGLSLSRFAEVFLSRLDKTPQAYIRHWRMTLARQDIERGDRVKAVSRRYGYSSSEAFAKAFVRAFGKNPLAMRGGRPMPAGLR